MLQRSEKQLVTRYGAAWVSALGNRPAVCRDDLHRLQGIQRDVPPFKRLIDDRLIAPADRIRLLQLLFPKLGLDTVTQAWLLQLARRRRLSLLTPCLEEAEARLSLADGRERARVISAHPIEDGNRTKIAEALARWLKLAQTPEIAWSVDPHVLTGFRCLIGSYLLDFTGDTKLKTIARTLDDGVSRL
jgi:F0F1-type ATP synthase delta subunit